MKSVEQLKAIYMFTFVPEFVTFHQKHIKLMSNDAGTTGPQDQARKEEPSQATQMVKGAPEKWRLTNYLITLKSWPTYVGLFVISSLIAAIVIDNFNYMVENSQ